MIPLNNVFFAQDNIAKHQKAFKSLHFDQIIFFFYDITQWIMLNITKNINKQDTNV